MKKFFLLTLLPLLLFSKDDVFIGGGPYFQTLPYKDADPVVLATPVIFFDNSLFYIRWTRVGMYFLGDSGETQSWGLSFTAQPQILGYYERRALTQLNQRSKTPILQGMAERDSGWEGGLSAAYARGDFFAEFLIMHDITDTNNGTKLRLEAGQSFSVGDWYFVPSVLAVWLSQPFANYYFGVKNSEENLLIGRPAYRSDATLNLAVQTYVKYNINAHWHLLGNLRADRFGDPVSESPLTETRVMYSGMLSLLYSFNLFGEEKAVLNPPEKR
ncbi:MipA/OmpV family protein [Sulfurimonas sp. HSL-1656]|uniref:MipA/OmpV family protein n=1 Tax=Thiomicrolovo subterrani TaxID=3131934 RepID=UPI0031F9C8BF